MKQRTRPLRSARPLGCQRLEPRLVLDASSLRITEFVASNDGSLTDFDGDTPDWVEIHNPSGSAVDLEGFYLSDDADDLPKWEFPSGTEISAGGYLIVFASDKDTVMPNGELHTSYKLSAGGEYLGLIGPDGVTVVHEYAPEYPQQVEDVSYGLEMQPSGVETTLLATGANSKSWRPTSNFFGEAWIEPGFNDAAFTLQGPTGIGYEASPGGQVDYRPLIETTAPTGLASLYVRVPFTLTDLTGVDRLTLRMKYDDGFVAYLNGVEIASANAPDSPAWNSNAGANHDDQAAIVFEEFDASLAISSLVVGENVLAIHGLNLPNSSDFLLVPELVAESSEIVSPDEVGFFETPTPGYGNGENFGGFAAEPVFSVPHGFYDTPQQVAITSDTPGAVIVYTTDGSLPTVDANLNPTNGSLYSGPVMVSTTKALRAIAFKQDFKPSFVNTSSYLFLNDVIAQSPQGQTPPGFAPDGTNGKDLDYGIDQEILALYGVQAVKDSLLSIPTITLTTDTENLFDPSTGIYVNSPFRGRSWEREASVELIHPDGSEGFSANAGLRIRGGFSRNDFNPKNAFRLYFRGEYGDTKLRYPLFGDEGVDEFDVLDLRTAQNYSWSSSADSQNTFLREVFGRDTQADLGQPYTRSRYYHLYLDGQYWGLYMTQERIEEFFGESYFGGDESQYDVVKSDLGVTGRTEIADGNDAAWRQLFDLAQALADDPNGAADNYWTLQGRNPDGTRNESLPVLLDAENLIDYMLVIFYTGGFDTGLSLFVGDDRANNWFGIRNREDNDQGFKFFIHDNEHSLGVFPGNPRGSVDIDRTGPFFSSNDDDFDLFNPHFLHQDLLVHPEYRQLFTDRAQRALFDGGALTREQSIERLLRRKAQVDPAIISEAARWGDSKTDIPFTKAVWQDEVDWLVDTYFPSRRSFILSQLRGDDLLSTFTAPRFSQHGGQVSPGQEITLAAGGGTIFYTTDGQTDPRLIGGAINTDAAVTIYSGPITFTQDTTIKARVRTGGGRWSGLVEATFSVPASPADYNGNGVVDQPDYAVWQTTYGSTTDLRADGNGDGRIDAADYAFWRDRVSPPAASLLGPAKTMAASSPESPGSLTPAEAPTARQNAFALYNATTSVSTSFAATSPAAIADSPDATEAALLLIDTASATADSNSRDDASIFDEEDEADSPAENGGPAPLGDAFRT